MPKTLPENVEKALATKLPKLAKTDATKRILLIERDQISLADSDIMGEIDRLSPKYQELKSIDEIWIVETSIQASDGDVYFRRFDQHGIIETMVFANGVLKQRRDHPRLA